MGRLLRVIEVSPATLNSCRSYAHDGFTLTRETLLTPEQAAVMEAAKACLGGSVKELVALINAVATLREKEGA